MKASNFLKYSEINTKNLDKWVRNAIAVYVSANYAWRQIDDNLEIDYCVKCSMRQWGIKRNSSDYKPLSKWAVFGHNLVIDSVLRDQHIIELRSQSMIESEDIKVALPSMSKNANESQLHSISNFEKMEVVSEISKSKAITQIRWLEIPGLMCSGVFFSTAQKSQIFVPINVNDQANELFSIEHEYRRDYIFEVINDNSLLEIRKST